MPIRKANVKIENGKVVFSQEILDYFESIRTEENSEWINKYFKVLANVSNFNAEKFNIHHIRPCFTFKDETHKNREDCEKVADKFNCNLIKLSIYNHLFAHYYLWKIFNNQNSKIAFQRMCGQGKYVDNLTEQELQKIARLKEESIKKNQTKEDRKKKNDEYNKSHKQEHKEYYKNHKEKIKKYKEENKDRIQKYQKEYNFNYYINNKDKLNKYSNDIRKRNPEKYNKYHTEYNKKYRKSDNFRKKEREYNAQLCYDPIKKEFCPLSALKGRKYHGRNKNEYINIRVCDCIIK